MIKRQVLAMVAGLAVATVSSVSTAASAQPATLEELLSTFHERYGFPGATAAIALPDGRTIAASVGLADIEAARPMTPDTPMLAASIGKSFVAATVLSLENEGVLSLADRVSAHIGDFDWFDRVPNFSTMTIHDLLRHASGLPDHVHLETFQSEMAKRMANGSPALSPLDSIAFVLDKDPLFPAQSGWAYTDTGYLLLGFVIEKAAARPYYDLVTERFIEPLGLVGTAPSDRRLLPGLAAGYVDEGNPFGLPSRTMDAYGTLLWEPAMEWTGGGLVSSSPDLAAWGQSLFKGRAMKEPYLDRLLDAIAVTPDAPESFYGAGVAIYTNTPRGLVYGHGGWIPGYVSSLRHYADYKVTVAFQINTDVGIADDSTDLAPALEQALADFAIVLAIRDNETWQATQHRRSTENGTHR